jgi:hypothetical protein
VSSIVWALIITASGMYGMPVRVELSFNKEIDCETARSTVTVQRQPVSAVCEPRRVAN